MSVRLSDLQDVSNLPSPYPPVCSGLDIAWVSEAAVAVAVAQRHDDGLLTRSLYAVTPVGEAAEILMEADDVCQLASEVDGAVVLGERSWSMLRDVPAAVQRVRPCRPVLHACMADVPPCRAMALSRACAVSQRCSPQNTDKRDRLYRPSEQAAKTVRRCSSLLRSTMPTRTASVRASSTPSTTSPPATTLQRYPPPALPSAPPVMTVHLQTPCATASKPQAGWLALQASETFCAPRSMAAATRRCSST